MKLRGLIVVLAATLGLGGCGAGVPDGPGTYFALAPEEVRARLERTPLPPNLFAFDSGRRRTRGVARMDGTVTWTVRKEGSAMLRYTATVTPSGEGTRVAVALEGVRSAALGDVEARLAQKPKRRHFYTVAMEESIAATIEGREYEATRVTPAMMASSYEQGITI